MIDEAPMPESGEEPRIVSIEGVCGGRPCIRGMRVRVVDVLEMLAGGASVEEIVHDYPYISREDIEACVRFARPENASDRS